MRMFKKVLAGFVAAAMVATMAGCGSSNSSTKDSGSDKAAAEATTEAAAPAKVLNTNAANKLIYCITTPEQMLLSKQFRKLMMLESLHSWLTVRSTKKVFAYLRS